MGTKRRFDVADLAALLGKIGFRIERTHEINKIGAVGWWFSSRVLHRSRISRPSLKLWDKSVWLLRRIDAILPWHGLSLVVVARYTGK
jgi:hypothetical protein